MKFIGFGKLDPVAGLLNKFSLFLLVSGIFLTGTIRVAAEQPFEGAENSGPSLKQKIDRLIRPLADSNNYSGTVVIRQNGKELFSKSYGLADRQRNIRSTKETRFFLASISAMFTSAAVMKLVDEGKISLDDKLSKYFPGFKNGDRITIHHMLTERTGLPRIGSQRKVNYSKLTESPQTLDQLIDYIKGYDLSFDPGTKYEHSRSSYILLARIIELVSGKTFGDYLDQEVFRPLGMKNSGHFTYETNYKDIPNLAMGYRQKGVSDLALDQQIHWSSKTGHASIFSTAADLARYGEAALAKELLSNDSWRKTLTDHHDSSFGYGWFVSSKGKRIRYTASGGSPGFSCYMAVYPKEKLVIVMLSNIKIHVPFFTVRKLAAIVFGEPYAPLDLITPPDIDPGHATKFVGTYQFGEDFYRPNGSVSITSKGSRLFAGGSPLLPIREKKGPVKRFINRRFWSTLEFTIGEDGKASILKFDDYKGKRLN